MQGQFDNIFLLYLSPESSFTELVLRDRRTLVLWSSPRRQSATVKVQSRTVEVKSTTVKVILASKDNLTCLKDLQWPAGCSSR